VRAYVFIFFLALAGCSKCGKTSTATASGVERVLPKGAVGVVVVPNIGAAGQKLKILEGLKVAAFAAQLRGFADGKGFADALVNELGIDVRSAEALEKAGVDGNGAAGIAALATGHGYLALPVKDASKFHDKLKALAALRLGAGTVGEKKYGELTVKTFGAGDVPKLGYALANGYALITDGAGLEKLAGIAAMTESDSLASDSGYKAEVAKLPAERDVVVYLPNGTPLLVQAPFTAVTGAVSLTAVGLAVSVNANWKGDAEQLAALQPQQVKSLLGYLPADAFLVARFSGDPSKLGPFAKQLMGPHLARAFDEAGFDVKAQVLDQLQPGAVASLSLAEGAQLGGGMPDLDIRRTNPFAYVNLSGVGAAKKPAEVLPTFEKIATIAPKFGAEMTVRDRADGQKAVITTYSQGEGVHFAPKGELVFFASPVQRLEALVKSDGSGAAPAGLGDEAVSVVIDLNKLAASVRALPESAWGLGGFAIKATTVRWLDATDDLKRITVTVGAKEKVVQAKIVLTLGGPSGAGK
jgi:hypothetical protein